ncbi:MAG: FHA domain-containing protein, partial [Cyanobacteria bacterium P01_F01_bin.42]
MSPSDSSQIRHALVLADDRGPRLIGLESSSYSIGREASNSLVIKAKDVSRQHALLLRMSSRELTSYGFILIDGDLQGKRSRNGIFINGQRWSTGHRLQHGDFIRFATQVVCRYLMLPAQSDQDFQKFSNSLDFTKILSEHEDLDWLSFTDTSLEESNETNDAFLIRLASFPEINPSPMFEVNLSGELTYLNPAAASAFQEISAQGSQHPTLNGLSELVQSSSSNILVREVTVENRVYEQSIHFLPESELIRCCAFDITERKHAESELKQRDRLLKSVAEATTHLLENVAYEAAIDAAIAKLGYASGADRICISANHYQAESQDLHTSLQFEWVRDLSLSVMNASHRYNQSFISSPLSAWYALLSQEQSIRGCLSDFPSAEQLILQREEVESILVVPIILDKSFWGFIELHHCDSERQWTQHDESIVTAMGASISAALQRQQAEQIIHHQAFH